MRSISLLLTALLAVAMPAAAAVVKPRVIVLADINSFKPEVGDTSAAQSLIRLMLYSDQLDIEGLVASSGLANGQKVRPDLINAVVSAYGLVQKNLILHSPDFPPAKDLAALIKSGQPVAGVNVRVNDSIGRTRNTEASDWIIAAVDKPDPRPLWICALGGTADLAQALWKVRDTRSEGDALKFVSRLRVHAVGDQDATGPWLRENFPSLHFINREAAFRGMYLGGDESLVSPDWIKVHARTGHGFLGEIYPECRAPDAWSKPPIPVTGIKETGSPTFLWLVTSGLSRPDRLGTTNWGGRLDATSSLRPVDSRGEPGPASDPDPRLKSVYRWRRAMQADFEARLDWCVKPREKANHAPIARLVHVARHVNAGQTVELDATGTTDPDGNKLQFEWVIDTQDAASASCKLEVEDPRHARLIVPDGVAEGNVGVLLIVRDDGTPPLEGYARGNFVIEP